MRSVLSLLPVAVLCSACGAGGSLGTRGSYYSNVPSGGGSIGIGCLEVTNDAASGAHVLVAVLLRDVATHVLLREEPVHLLPGQVANVMSIPAGFYEVVGVFEDWVHVPLPPAPPVVVEVHPDLDAAARFRHP
jgi:hypothetical protein